MTYISIVCRKVGSLIISKVTDDNLTTVEFYKYNSRQNDASRAITELKHYITVNNTDITVVNFPRDSSIKYFNEIYGSLITLKKFGLVNKLTFIDDPMKMYNRIHQYLNASKKKRKRNIQGISKLLLEGSACGFYTNETEIIISNNTNQVHNLLRLGIITLYYSIIKERLINIRDKSNQRHISDH